VRGCVPSCAPCVERSPRPARFTPLAPCSYIPVLPVTLVDYLEAPTPFLMGLVSSPAGRAALDTSPSVAAQLVVADLDWWAGVFAAPRRLGN
jgi:hypothetical protein